MSYSRRPFLHRICFWAVAGVSLLAVRLAQGQVQHAACTFSYFLLNPADASNPTSYVADVNDWGTVVGSSDFGTTTKAFAHYSGGSLSYWRPSGAMSSG